MLIFQLTFRLNRVNLVWQISQNMVVDDSGVESVPDEGFTELLDCLVPQNPVLPIEGLQLAPEPPLTNWKKIYFSLAD